MNAQRGLFCSIGLMAFDAWCDAVKAKEEAAIAAAAQDFRDHIDPTHGCLVCRQGIETLRGPGNLRERPEYQEVMASGC